MEEACQARSIEIRKQEVSYDVRQATVDFSMTVRSLGNTGP